MVATYKTYIGGKFIETSNYTKVYNKYDGSVIGEISQSEKEHIDLAVDKAEEMFNKKKLTTIERHAILTKAAEIIKTRREEIETMLIEEVGKTKKDAIGELDRTIVTLQLSAEEAKYMTGEMIPLHALEEGENQLGFTIRVPKGVIAAITPFNYPVLLGIHKIAPAIASGNTIIVKPATTTPLTTYKLVSILEEAGLPKGYINIVPGKGSQVGDWLLDNKKIKMYTFTGSSEVGQHIKNNSGMRPVALELGNNSPNIVHEDADLEKAAKEIASKSFHNAGQACIAVQRIYVHDKVIEQFKEKYMTHVNKLKVGNPFNSDTDVGPMINEQEAIRVYEWAEEALRDGANALTEIKREGAILHPVVLENTKEEMKVMCQEVFAPLVTITSYENLDDVLKKANNSDYGLQAGIFTNDIRKIMKSAIHLEYGGIIVNGVSTYRNDVMPYGGMKSSGLGKEGPKYTIKEMTDEKMIVINY